MCMLAHSWIFSDYIASYQPFVICIGMRKRSHFKIFLIIPARMVQKRKYLVDLEKPIMRIIDNYPICDLYPQYQTSLLPITLEIGPRVNVIAKISCMFSFVNLGFTYSVSTHSSHAT